MNPLYNPNLNNPNIIKKSPTLKKKEIKLKPQMSFSRLKKPDDKTLNKINYNEKTLIYPRNIYEDNNHKRILNKSSDLKTNNKINNSMKNLSDIKNILNSSKEFLIDTENSLEKSIGKVKEIQFDKTSSKNIKNKYNRNNNNNFTNIVNTNFKDFLRNNLLPKKDSNNSNSKEKLKFTGNNISFNKTLTNKKININKNKNQNNLILDNKNNNNIHNSSLNLTANKLNNKFNKFTNNNNNLYDSNKKIINNNNNNKSKEKEKNFIKKNFQTNSNFILPSSTKNKIQKNLFFSSTSPNNENINIKKDNTKNQNIQNFLKEKSQEKHKSSFILNNKKFDSENKKIFSLSKNYLTEEIKKNNNTIVASKINDLNSDSDKNSEKNLFNFEDFNNENDYEEHDFLAKVEESFLVNSDFIEVEANDEASVFNKSKEENNEKGFINDNDNDKELFVLDKFDGLKGNFKLNYHYHQRRNKFVDVNEDCFNFSFNSTDTIKNLNSLKGINKNDKNDKNNDNDNDMIFTTDDNKNLNNIILDKNINDLKTTNKIMLNYIKYLKVILIKNKINIFILINKIK